MGTLSRTLSVVAVSTRIGVIALLNEEFAGVEAVSTI
jgi:hypothetical protein